jgi:glycosyltransferase involved in cell wall biosynthesis
MIVRDAIEPVGNDRKSTSIEAPAAPIRILQVSTYDVLGGAARVAWNLFRTYRRRGHSSWLAVGQRLDSDPDVFALPNSGIGWLDRVAKVIDRHRGIEDFRFPGTWRLLDLPPQRPDVVHAHNLHGAYFDLRALSWLSREVPAVLTLHDAWLLSGHCAHSLDCERWLTGCGSCPYLDIDPPVLRDATARNWRRKAEIFDRSRIYVATPSRWLMNKVERSMLVRGVVDARVIHNGVDQSIFRPRPSVDARGALGLPTDAMILAFAANVARHNAWKDFETLRSAMRLVGEGNEERPIIFLALGEEGESEWLGRTEIRPVGYEASPDRVAAYFQAADVYVHASRADTFPNSIIEALACGTPVVATAVGGIPEQIDDGRTGILVPPADPAGLAMGVLAIASDDDLRRRLSHAAADVAAARFGLEQQADAYLDWYHELLEQRAALGADDG